MINYTKSMNMLKILNERHMFHETGTRTITHVTFILPTSEPEKSVKSVK